MRHALCSFVVIVACGEPMDDQEPGDTDASETAAPGTDSPDPTDVPEDTDALGPTDDTSAPPTPPTWSGGFVELLDPVWSVQPFTIDPGSRDLARPPQLGTALYADLDGDGVPEVIVGASGQHGAPFTRVLRWSSGAWILDPELAAAMGPSQEPPIAAVDLDLDGKVDLVRTSMSGLVQWGQGDGWGPAVGLEVLPAAPADRHVGVTVYDIDDDGWLDLLLSHGGCGVSTSAAIQTAPGRFAWLPSLAEEAGHGASHSAFGTLLENGQTVVFGALDACETPSPHPGWYRDLGAGMDGTPRMERYDATPADAWWRQPPVSRAEPITRLGPAGGGFRDLDGDGRLDVVVTTATEVQTVLAGRGDGRFTQPPLDRLLRRPLASDGTPFVPWGVDFPDLDMDGRPDLVMSVGDGEDSFHAANDEPMANAVYWNGGAFRWEDVSADLGLVQTGSYRALGLADPDHDGDADLLFGGQGHPPRAYRNDIDVGTRGISLRLRGSTSNRLGIGARVEVHVRGLAVQVGVVGGVGNPLGSSEPVLFFGAGSEATIELVRIRWPSSLLQELRGLEAGTQHVIEEPATLTVLDADRHAPADGTSRVRTQVLPRLVDGSVDLAAVVTFTLDGPGTLGPVVTTTSGLSTVDVTAPAQPGTSVLRARIDGVLVEVRPRLRWDPVPSAR